MGTKIENTRRRCPKNVKQKPNENNELCCLVLQKGCCRQTSQLQKIRSYQSRQKRIQSQHGRYAGSQTREEVRVLVLLASSLRRGHRQAGCLPCNQGWSPCIEFSSQELADTTQLFFAGPALYEGRYWTMWKLPMFGCSDPQQVLNEIEECQKEYPGCRVRVVGFDRVRQVQMA